MEEQHAAMVAGLIASASNRFNRMGVRIHDPSHAAWERDVEIIVGREAAGVRDDSEGDDGGPDCRSDRRDSAAHPCGGAQHAVTGSCADRDAWRGRCVSAAQPRAV